MTVSISGVSGTYAHGESIVISGSGFGTKTHAGPAIYDDFDDEVGTNLNGIEPTIHQGVFSAYASWERGTNGVGAGQIVRNTTGPKARSINHARMVFDDPDFWSLRFDLNDSLDTGEERYFSYYFRYRKTSANHGRQMKALMWFPEGSGVDAGYWSTAFDTCEAGGFRQHITSPTFEQGSGIDGPDIDNEWVRFEHYIKQSGANQANGNWHVTTYRPNLVTPAKEVLTIDSRALRNTGDGPFDLWEIGGAFWDWCDVADTATIDVDEIVVDSQRARVEIANASTWAARTFSEYQVATAWADGEITCTLNAGHHGDTDTVYLYVIDSAGLVNANGFPITLGEGGGEPEEVGDVIFSM